MKILFVHNNFPAQFAPLATALVGEGAEVAAIGSLTARPLKGVRLVRYALGDGDVSRTHPFARRFEGECRRAEQVLYGLSSLLASGFTPDIIVAHPGWGETLPLKTVFPSARLLLYCEFFYGSDGRDIGFDPEFPAIGLDGGVGLKLKNAATLLALAEADATVSPTKWQRSTFPQPYRDAIRVIHEGVDTDRARPDSQAEFTLASGGTLRGSDQVVTFVARNLEPLRGYHVFARALPRILVKAPDAHIVIVGGDGTSYGMKPQRGRTWKSIFLDEVADSIDMSRVHFTGRLPYQRYLKALQVSSAHVYLTYPFVLSWSAVEALSAGCVVIGSDTAPVREIIDDGKNGVLVPFFDVDGLADRVIDAVKHPHRFERMRASARELAVTRYDSLRKCVPDALALVRSFT